MPKGITLTPEQQASRRLEIMNHALGLFHKQGVEKTSMREIAQAAHMGKSSLYDYFTSKDEIVVYAVEEAIKSNIQQAKSITDTELSHEQRIRQIMQMNLSFTAKYLSLLAWLGSEGRFMDEENRSRIANVRHTYQDIVQTMIQDGIDAGSFHTNDPALATRLLINSMLSIAYTSRPSDSMDNMLEEATNIFLRGILAKPYQP